MTGRSLDSLYGATTDTSVDAITMALRHAFDKNGDRTFDAKDLTVKGADAIPAYARDGLTTAEISTALADFQTKSNVRFAEGSPERIYNDTLISNARVANGDIGQSTMTWAVSDTVGYAATAAHDVPVTAPVYSDLKPENTPAGTAPGVYVTAKASNGADEGAWQVADAARKDPKASARIRNMSTNDLAAEIRMMNGLADGYASVAPGTALIVDIDRFVQNNGDAVAAMGGKPFFIAKIDKANSNRMVEVPAPAPGYAGTVMMPESQLATANTIAAYATLPFAPCLMGLRNAGPHENYERVSYNHATQKWERTLATQKDLDDYAHMTKAPAEEIRVVSGIDIAKATVIPTATAMFFAWGTPKVISYLKGPAQATEGAAAAETTVAGAAGNTAQTIERSAFLQQVKTDPNLLERNFGCTNTIKRQAKVDVERIHDTARQALMRARDSGEANSNKVTYSDFDLTRLPGETDDVNSYVRMYSRINQYEGIESYDTATLVEDLLQVEADARNISRQLESPGTNSIHYQRRLEQLANAEQAGKALSLVLKSLGIDPGKIIAAIKF